MGEETAKWKMRVKNNRRKWEGKEDTEMNDQEVIYKGAKSNNWNAALGRHQRKGQVTKLRRRRGGGEEREGGENKIKRKTYLACQHQNQELESSEKT